MVKCTLSISIEGELADKLKKIADENNMKISVLAGRVIETGLRYGEPVNVICPMCSTLYSNKEGFCPKCKKELEEREVLIQTETQLISLKARLDKLLEWKEKGFFVTDNEIQKVRDKIKEIESNG